MPGRESVGRCSATRGHDQSCPYESPADRCRDISSTDQRSTEERCRGNHGRAKASVVEMLRRVYRNSFGNKENSLARIQRNNKKNKGHKKCQCKERFCYGTTAGNEDDDGKDCQHAQRWSQYIDSIERIIAQ